MMDKWKNEAIQRLLDSALVGAEKFMEDHTGWFILLTYLLLISAMGTLSSILRTMSLHVRMVWSVLIMIFRGKPK